MTHEKAPSVGCSVLASVLRQCEVRQRVLPTVASAHMNMPQVRVRVPAEVAKELNRSAAARWPGQGKRAVDRVAREAIRTYVRQTNGKK